MKSLPILSALALLLQGQIARGQSEAATGTDARHPIYNLTHFDVLPMAMGGVDFLQSGYALLFKYRDQSRMDRGLQSFRILNLLPPTTNHSEIVQVWSSYDDYLNHLAQAHTIAFRFDVQNNTDLGGVCCIGSPIDDRQYRQVQSIGTPWSSSDIPPSLGPAGRLYVVSYVEFQPQANVESGQTQLILYGTATRQGNGTGLLNYTLLRQLDRPNRYAILEVWDDRKHYAAWQSANATRMLLSNLKPLLESPPDHRLAAVCGETFVANRGCTVE